jgi:hypothetical protein
LSWTLDDLELSQRRDLGFVGHVELDRDDVLMRSREPLAAFVVADACEDIPTSCRLPEGDGLP